MRRRPRAVNLENVTSALADAAAVAREARRSHIDAVWIHAFGVPTLSALRTLALVLGARSVGRPAVVQFHAFGLEAFVADGGPVLRNAIRTLAAVAGAIVVEHEPAAEALRSMSGDTHVYVLNNWVDVPDEAPPLPARPPLRLVFVGGLVRRKGAPQIIEAMRALEDVPVELRLVGGAGEDGPAALESLHAATNDLVQAGRISFAGEKDPAGVRTELRSGHLFVLASDAEGMPLAMLEAMAEGRATLVTDAGNMRTIVEETGCGWVLPDREPATIAAHVRRIVADPIALAAASAAAWQAATARYSAGARRAEIDGILASLRPKGLRRRVGRGKRHSTTPAFRRQ
jgi:glycosyltransferase involved in cell wall biosynthesis